MKVGPKAYGVQGHLELDDEMFKVWVAHDHDLQKMDSAGLRADYERVKAEYHSNCRKIFENFLKVSGLVE